MALLSQKVRYISVGLSPFSLQPFQVIATHLMILQTKLDWNLVLIKVNTKRPQQRGFTKGQGWAPVSNVGK